MLPTSMRCWTLADTNSAQGRMFQRPLGLSEHGFFLDGLFNGTADCIHHIELHLSNGSRDAHLFSEASLVKAWLSTKRRYPLAGAIVQGRGKGYGLGVAIDPKADGSTGFSPEFHFVVREHDFSTLRGGEVIFEQVADAEEARHRVDAILNGPRPLSPELLSQLYVFREAGSDEARANVLHLTVLMAHCITDGMATWAFGRCLVDTLSRGGESDAEPAQMPLEDRLATAISAGELQPTHLHTMSLARRRWRKAVAVVISQLRMEKMQGGHTLPCRLTRSTWCTAARSRFITAPFTHAQSAAVIVNCRRHNFTFGNAYLVLAQVAMTRVLYRRYIRGEMSEEEWMYRKRQPYINGGPFNLRPYLDKTWLQTGGGGEFVLSIGFFFTQLPFMTLGGTDKFVNLEYVPTSSLSDGAPPLSELLSFDRFLNRTALVKKQTTAYFNHPLLFEIEQAQATKFNEHRRLCALQWTTRVKTGDRDGFSSDKDEALVVTDFPTTWAHVSSSFGNVDLIFPLEYPLPSTHALSPYSPVPHPIKAGYITPSPSLVSQKDAETRPKIVVEYNGTRIHTRPGELYLGAATSCGQLHMNVFYDGNVFEEGVVREWLDEVKGAVLWYLGHGGEEHARLDRGIGAKL